MLNKYRIFLLLSCLFAPNAWALERLSLAGDLVRSTLVEKTNSGSASPYFPSTNFGIGLMAEYHLFNFGSLNQEIGYQYIPRSFSDRTATYTSHTFRIPVLMRFYPDKNVSISLGGYYSHGFGSLTLNYIGTNTAAANTTYQSFGLKRDDLGVSGSIQVNFGNDPGFYFEGAYSRGLRDLSLRSDRKRFFSDFQFLLGISLLKKKRSSLGFGSS